MRRQTLLTVLTAAMLVLAGCAGSAPGDSSATPAETATPGDEVDESDTTDDTDGTSDDDGTGGTAVGTVQFYLSDNPGQMDDFRHLNVTITEIGFERAGGSGDDTTDDADANESDGEMNESDDDTTANETTTDETSTNSTDGGVAGAEGDEEEDEEEMEDEEGEEGEEMKDEESEEGEEMEDEESEEGAEEGEEGQEGEEEGEEGEGGDGWITKEIDSRTVDLTRLRGDNATLIDSPELPAGNYTKVFVYVSDVNATLTDGTSQQVKLPSGKLQLTKGFTLEPNSTVSFVYDISVFKAGNSGKYILKPVISESGADQEVRDVDEERGPDRDDGGPDDDNGGPDEDSEAGPPRERGNN